MGALGRGCCGATANVEFSGVQRRQSPVVLEPESLIRAARTIQRRQPAIVLLAVAFLLRTKPRQLGAFGFLFRSEPQLLRAFAFLFCAGLLSPFAVLLCAEPQLFRSLAFLLRAKPRLWWWRWRL